MEKENEKEEAVFEIAVVIPRRVVKEKDEDFDFVNFLIKEFRKVGFIADSVHGISEEFIKVRLLNSLPFVHNLTCFAYEVLLS